MQKYIIFDRDGTLIKYVPYLCDSQFIRIEKKTILGLILLKRNGFKFGVISNQSVIGRGIASEDQVISVNTAIMKKLDFYKISFDFFFYCPHDPISACKCRKPKTALGLKAISEFDIDVANSYMIGDMDSDIEFGIALNLRTIKLSVDNTSKAQFTTRNVLSAADWILKPK